ncbi:MAG: efflux RND transporter periplasmic adaptor subunit [Gemmatimonadetes bacterium]|nr:efflux RND transporter periplasmic adaptor subunit [Gemmatimonadota bacterium]MCC6771383.1 efflux RND transporter periplasmic adaptor subunit [Gemmatimonadaceae bacterium]
MARRLLLLALLTACDKPSASGGAIVAATVANPVKESDLTTVTLGEEAERRLRIAVDTAAPRRLAVTRVLPGEVMAAPGQAQRMVAPVAGRVARVGDSAIPLSGKRVTADEPLLALVPMAPDRDLQRTHEEAQVAEARLTRARLEAERVAALWNDRLVSARDREVAEAELAVAQATRDAAAGRAQMATGSGGVPAGVATLVLRAPFAGVVQALSTGEGQVVAAGTPLVDIARLDGVWVRVPAYVGDLSRLDTRGRAAITRLGASPDAAFMTGVPVVAPPSADAVSASADLYYAVANPGAVLRPGERVQVAVPLQVQGAEVLTVPWASVVFDYSGGTWVYERVAPRQYVRRRISLGEVSGAWAEVRGGLAAGAVVVTDGAAELLGTEFGAGK